MSGKNLFTQFVLTLLFTLSTVTAAAQSGKWTDPANRSASFGLLYNYRTEFHIDNEGDLAKFAYMVRQGHNFYGKKVTMRANLRMKSHYWVPVGTQAHPFCGTFNGNGYSISGLITTTGEGGDAGLFGSISGASVSNVLLVDCRISENDYTGAVAGQAQSSTIKNCRVEGDVSLSGKTAVGAIAGSITENSGITGCSAEGFTLEGDSEQPLAGRKDSGSRVTNSISEGDATLLNGVTPVYSVNNLISGATLTYGTVQQSYNVSNIIIYGEGLSYGSKRRAVEGETVSFSVDGVTVTPRTKVMANGELLTASGGTYTLTMPARDVDITLEEPALHWTSGGTLCTLQGTTMTVTATDGTGAMADYTYAEDVPWKNSRSDIRDIVFADGVTAIGACAFNGFDNIKSVAIPLSVTRIGNHAFSTSTIGDVYCYPPANGVEIGNNSFGDVKPRWHVFSAQLSAYQQKPHQFNVNFLGDLKDVTLDASGDNAAILAAADGSTCDVTLQGLKLVREGFTLCVPFTVSDIAQTPLAGAEIREMLSIRDVGQDVRIACSAPVTRIEAGKLYQGRWTTAGGDLQNPVFRGVTVSAAAPQQKDYSRGSLKGFYAPLALLETYTAEWEAGAWTCTRGRTHSAFKGYVLTSDMNDEFKFVTGDCTVSVTHSGKPSWWPDVEVTCGTEKLATEDVVAKGSTVEFSTTAGVGYDLEWYVNGQKRNVHDKLTLKIDGNTRVEVRYIERKKLTYKGSPLVRYADSKGVVNITQNYYNYDYKMLRAFGYTVDQWTGSNATVYLVDNMMLPGKMTSVTLTEDMEMTPHTVLNEEDMGDNTVCVKWRFDDPVNYGLFRNLHGEGARFPYVQPTEFSSYFIDVAMTVDATQGLITNDLRQAEGNTFIGKGTRLTVPAKYGATYKLLTTKPVSEVSIAGSRDFIRSESEGKSLSTMHYYRTDLDSVVVEIDEDIELVWFEATYPGGDNTMMIRPAVNKAESAVTTVSKTGEAGCLLYELSDIENHGRLKVTPSAFATGTSLIEMPESFDENRYMSVSFRVKEGYSFKPKTTNVYTMPVNTGTKANVRIMLIDERGNKADTVFQNVPQNVMKLDTLKPKAPSKAQELCLYGKVELRIYAYGVTGNYRLGDSIKIDGELCQTIQFPEGQRYMMHPVTSAIDFDGQGLLTVDAYQVVGADKTKRTVTRTALEECHMGNIVLLVCDTPGSLYNIPLTRPDDSYVPGQGIVKISDGTVIGTKSHYVYAQRDGLYAFYMAAIGDPIDKGSFYFEKEASEDVLAYYLMDEDVPPTVGDVVLYADADNTATIQANMGRVIDSVTLGGRTFYKDGRWNVVCLPFHIQGRNIRNTPLKNATICEFIPEGSSFDPETGALDLSFESAYEIEAGVPYLVRWNSGEDIANPVFTNVSFTNDAPSPLVSSDGRVAFRPSYGTVNLKKPAQQPVTVRRSMAADSLMHAMKAYFSVQTPVGRLTDVATAINEDNAVVTTDVDDGTMRFSVHYNTAMDYDVTTLSDYHGEGGVVTVPDSIPVAVGGKELMVPLRRVGSLAFDRMGNAIRALDMSRCEALEPLAVSPTIDGASFCGLDRRAIIYLPAGKANRADNVVLDGECSRLVLDDRFGFTPLCDFHATDVELRRSTTASGGWQSLCLPFELSPLNFIDRHGELMEFAGAKKENGTLSLFCNRNRNVPAGHPAIVRWTQGAPAKLTFANVHVTADTATVDDFNGVAFSGNYDPVVFTEADLASLFVADSREGSFSLPGFQAHFLMDDGATDDFNTVCVTSGNLSDYEAVEPLIGHFDVAYALWCEGNRTLYFTVPGRKIRHGSIYDGQTVTNAWNGNDVLATTNAPVWQILGSAVEHIVFDESFQRVRPTSLYAWFADFENLKDIEGLYFLRTSEVTTMARMFEHCASLEGSLSFSFFDTSNVTDMSYMFYGCSALDYLQLEGFNTAQVTTMEGMFGRCTSLTGIILPFDTRVVTSMCGMFYECNALEGLDLSTFTTDRVTDMSYMFSHCQSLKDLDLTGFNTASVKYMQGMFDHDVALATVTVGPGWTVDGLDDSRSMLYCATSLVGQQGTAYSYTAAMSGSAYAHIDGGRDNPGLFWGVADVALTDLADNTETLNRYGGHKVNVSYDRQLSATDNGDGSWTSRAFTTCLPYTKDLSAEFEAGQVRLYRLVAVTPEREFVFAGEFPIIQAGTPYLVVVEQGTVDLSAEGVKMMEHPVENVGETFVTSDYDTQGDEGDLVGWWRGAFRVMSNDECTELHTFVLTVKDGKWRSIGNNTEAERRVTMPQFRGFYVPQTYPGDVVHTTVLKPLKAGEDDPQHDWETLPDEFAPDVDDPTGIRPLIRTVEADGTHRYYDLSGRRLPGKPQRGVYIDNGVKKISNIK